MLIAIIGENCVGKSTLANKLQPKLNAKIYSGKDYLRLEKNPSVALEKFKLILKDSVNGDNIIYLITEKEHLDLLPEGTFKIVLTAELNVIKKRFKERMRGNLPLPLEKMLEVKHGMYDNLECNIKLDLSDNIDEIIKLINNDIKSSIYTIKEIKHIIKPILNKYGITEIYLFGSYARGEAKETSDIDIYCDKGNIKTFINQGLLEDELEESLNKKVDIIFETSDIDEYFKKQIMEDMIKLC